MLAASEIGTSVGEHQREYLYKMAIITDPALSSQITNYSAIKDNMDLYNVKGIFPNRKNADILIRWAGESYHFAGVDESTKNGDLTFRADEDGKIYRFWSDFKNMTGDDDNHVAQLKNSITFDMEVYQVSVDKETVTNAVILKNVQVLGVGDLTVDKEGQNTSMFTVSIVWDKSLPDYDVRGRTI